MRILPCLTVALAAFTSVVRAHHGLDFLVVQDAALPAPWSGMVYANAEWSQTDSINSYETETGVQIGITPWLAFGASSGFAESGDSWEWTQAAPNVHLSLFRSEAIPWLRVSLFAGYAFAEDPEVLTTVVMKPYQVRESKLTPSSILAPTSSGTGKSSGGNASSSGQSKKAVKHAGHGTVVVPVAPPPKKVDKLVTVLKPVEVVLPPEDHRGIHRHGEEGITARLIVEAEMGSKDKLIFNLINFTPRHGRAGWGYAAGWRHEFSHHFASSLEAIGDYETDGYQQAIVAAHWSPLHALTLKLGVGAGLSDETPDLSVHAGVVWRF